MNNEDLFNYFTTDNMSGKKCTEKWLSKNNFDLYQLIIYWCSFNNLKDIEFKRKVYHYINNLCQIPVCIECGKDVKYLRLKDGYQQYCSSSCKYNSNIYKEKWINSWKNGNNNNEYLIRREKTIISKYNSLEQYNKIIKKSKIKTCLERYGVEYNTQTDSFKIKRKRILEQKYNDACFNNPDKTRKTRIKNGTQINDEFINNFMDYKKIVINRTLTIYRNNKKLINPENLKRSKKNYHIDHLFSIKQGFLQNIPIEIITHPCNLHMIYYKDNLKKQDNCWISTDKLLNNIISYDKNIEFKYKYLKESYSNVVELSKKLLKEFKK
jgi:hypothetical protein